MKKILVMCLSLYISLCANAQATDLVVDCQTPGWLSSYINPKDINTLKNLKVIGIINQTDLATIGNLAKNYNLNGCLDLSEVNIDGDKLSGDMFGVSECQLECFRIPLNIQILEGACDWVELDTLIAGGSINNNFTYATNSEQASAGRYYSQSHLFNAKHLVLYEGTTSLSMVGYGTNSPLQSITFPESMKAINNLSYFPNLISMNLPSQIEILGPRTYTGLRLGSDTLFVPKSVKEFDDRWVYDDGYYGKGGHIKCIYLPDGLEKLAVTHGCLHYGANVSIHIKKRTPPQKVDGWFESPTVVYVPVGCKDIYMSRWENAVITEEIYAEQIDIDIPEVIHTGDSQLLKAEFTPNNTTFQEVMWESSNDVIFSISANGMSTANHYGTVQISATNADCSCICRKTVQVYDHTTGISISENVIRLKIGEKTTLIGNTLPIGTTDGMLTWKTDDEKVAVVNQDGIVTAVGRGICNITISAVDGDYNASCQVTVLQSVEALTIEKHALSLKVGEAETIYAQITPTSADNKTITWSSSNNQVATVDDNGNVQALKAGEAWIKAISVDNAEAKDSCKVTVIQPVTGVAISLEDYTFDYTGESIQLVATVLPEDASNKEVRWSSSNENVCIVQNGLVTAIAAGTATITVTTVDGNYTANCIIKVIQHVTKVEVNKSDISLKVAESEHLTATVSPANAENKNLVWSSSNNQVATVDANGNVQALKAGEAWIKAVSVDNTEAKDSCKVTVIQPVTGITISQPTIQFTNIGENIQLEATVLPEDASNKEVTWTSSNESVCMVANGKVIATGYGTAVVMAITKDGGFMANCSVIVEKETVPVTGITLSQTSATLKKGETLQLEATVTPDDATNKTLIWKSSDETKCVVTQTGLLVALNEGQVIITVVPENGVGQAQCNVLVVDEGSSISTVSVDGSEFDVPIYDIMGQRVLHLVKGHLYICNGKKFIAK